MTENGQKSIEEEVSPFICCVSNGVEFTSMTTLQVGRVTIP